MLRPRGQSFASRTGKYFLSRLVFVNQRLPKTCVKSQWGLGENVIEIEIQNETHQTQFRLKVVAVPRIGEGIRLREPDGAWASYDVLDVWYQKADFGDVWTPYLHVRATPGSVGGGSGAILPVAGATASVSQAQAMPIEEFLAKFEGPKDHEPIRLNLDVDVESDA